MRRGKGRPTIDTISARAGVSASTVSRALRGDARISKTRRETIVQIAKDVGYFPNANARSLITSRSGLIGFIMGDTANPFYNELLEQLVRSAALRQMRIMLLHVGKDQLAETALDALMQYQMDGCIISSLELDSRAADVCERNQVPVVMINRVPRTRGAAVSCDNFEGARSLMRLLLSAEHKKIAIIEGTPNSSTSGDRLAGALKEMRACAVEPVAIIEGKSNYRNAYAATLRLLDSGATLDGIFAVNDIMAFGAIDALRDRHLSVPDDVSVAGFDDVEQASWPSYNLTTVTQPIREMVERALDHLEERIRDPNAINEQSFIRGQLRIRGSVRRQ